MNVVVRKDFGDSVYGKRLLEGKEGWESVGWKMIEEMDSYGR